MRRAGVLMIVFAIVYGALGFFRFVRLSDGGESFIVVLIVVGVVLLIKDALKRKVEAKN